MIQYKNILITLALLLTAASGAWAKTDPNAVYWTNETWAGWAENVTTHTVGDITITCSGNAKAYESTSSGEPLAMEAGANDAITFTSNGKPFKSIKIQVDDNSDPGVAGWTWVGSEWTIEWSGTPSTSVTLSGCNIKADVITFTFGTAEAPITVEWNASTKTGTFTQPGSDVVLTPIYAKTAAFATTGTEPEVKTLLPEAAEGVIAGTDASLIAEGTGIVAFAGTSTEDTQGKLMYAVTSTNQATAPALTAFSATVPTAKDYDDAATVYVWYYIQGQDTPDGQEATEENTFNDTEICITPLTVQVLTNKFDLTLKAANANNIDATQASKGTVSVAGQPATVTDGKIKAVKMGSEVKMTTAQGYKFRKVEVKKTGSAVLVPALENGATVVIICNWGYATTTFTYTNNGGTFSGQASGYEAEYFNNGLELNGKNLSFGASNVDNSEYLSVGITFNTESSAYSYTGKGQDFVSFTISVNGTDVTSQLTEVK